MLYITFGVILLVAVEGVFVANENYVGCFVHRINDQWALKFFSQNFTKMAPYLCLPNCQVMDQKFFGITKNQCFCGNELHSIEVPRYRCNQRCSGKQETRCGGLNVMSVYKVTGVTIPLVPAPSKGCFFWSPTERVLHKEVKKNFQVMNQKECASSCFKIYRKLFGLANGNRCYCGNQILNGNPMAKRFCNQQCQNAQYGQKCGGPLAIEIFDLVPTES
ncbi:hypothetical protein BOX15_Mlig020751g3 [Macrostomum lignano]|uniref:WSC domain-containing protein n=1 Tax=Macrostomum lignano TaxID=282301 RepID=A0A267H1W5_9PLAT|nr:hypothetical protein BOX15_Mlig020751g3 [Macrostomum lignano]